MPAGPEGNKALLTLCLLPPQDMRKHVTMTLLDTEQSYVESLRTLMQVRLEAGPAAVLSLGGFQICRNNAFVDRGPDQRGEDPGTHHPTVGNLPCDCHRGGSREECAGAIMRPDGPLGQVLPSAVFPPPLAAWV